MERENIALIGFMGTGKTTVGKRLAKMLGKKYVSTDEYIVKEVGKPVEEIFENYGEIKFREAEIKAVKKLSKLKNVVIDCGGGVVLNKINIDRLKENGLIILLTASPKVILKRLKKCKNEKRPLLKSKSKLKKIKSLLAFRKPFYEMAADYRIDTSNLSVNEVVRKIIKIWERWKSGNHNRKK
jgi:shikimate kinase